MDEDNITAVNAAQAEGTPEPDENTPVSIRNRPFIIITVCLAVLAIVVLIAAVAASSEKTTQSKMDDARYIPELMTYESQAGRVFGSANGRIVMASCVETSAYDSKGRISYQEPFEAQSPALVCSGGMAAAYDCGGTSLRVFNTRKTITDYNSREKIISAGVNENGWCAVCTMEEGYKGSVTVLNSRGDAVFKWSSAGGYVFSAAISPDNRRMAVVTLRQEEDVFSTVIDFFSLGSGETCGTYKIDNSIVLAVKYGRDDVITCLAEDRAVVLNSVGEEQGVYLYGDRSLNGFSLEPENYFVLSLSRTYADTYSDIAAVDLTGSELGSAKVMGAVKAVSAGENAVAVLLNDTLALFSPSMVEKGGLTSLSGAKNVFFDPDENAVILSPTSAVLYRR